MAEESTDSGLEQSGEVSAEAGPVEEVSAVPEFEPFEAHIPRRSLRIELAVMALLFPLSVFMVAMGVFGPAGLGVYRSLLFTFFGLIGAPMSLAAVRNVLQFLKDPRPALRISEEGILNRTFLSSMTMVPWEEVVDIRKTRHRWILEIVLRDPDWFRARQTPLVRFSMRSRERMGYGPFAVFLPQIDAPREEVTRRLLDVVEARQLAAVRDRRMLEGPSEIGAEGRNQIDTTQGGSHE
jgi:hypothetical protein